MRQVAGAVYRLSNCKRIVKFHSFSFLISWNSSVSCIGIDIEFSVPSADKMLFVVSLPQDRTTDYVRLNTKSFGRYSGST